MAVTRSIQKMIHDTRRYIEEFSCNTTEKSIEFRIMLDCEAVLLVIDGRRVTCPYLEPRLLFRTSLISPTLVYFNSYISLRIFLILFSKGIPNFFNFLDPSRFIRGDRVLFTDLLGEVY